MAKSNNEESKARRPARRRSDKAPTPPAHQASEMGAPAAEAPRSERMPRSIESMSLKDADFFPAPEEVQRRAYELYLKRGGAHGRDLEDWYEAERQLRRQQLGS